MTGSPQKQEELSVSDAIAIARRHRDQLVAGSEILGRLPYPAADDEYSSLQKELAGGAPDICNTAWDHKYFSLLFPNKLDDYHAEEYQRFHLVKLLKRPPEGAGRYLAAGMFVRIARELEWPLNHLTSVLNRINGRPYRTWRVGNEPGRGRVRHDLADDARQRLRGHRDGRRWETYRNSNTIGSPRRRSPDSFESTMICLPAWPAGRRARY